jgi:hypothetical protein
MAASLVMLFGVILSRRIFDSVGIFAFTILVFCGVCLYFGVIYLSWVLFKTGPFGEIEAFRELF